MPNIRCWLLSCLAVVVVSASPVGAVDDLPGIVKSRQAGSAFAKGELETAIQLYGEALKDTRLTNDRKAVILTDRGVAQAQSGRTKQALTDFNTAIKLFPEYAAAYNNRGSLLLSLGIAEEAIKDFNRAIILAPGYVASYNNRAAALVKKQQLEIALVDYSQAVSLAPGQAPPLGGRARIKLARGRPYGAMRDLNQALTNDPRFAPAYRLRGRAHSELGDFEKAAQDLSRAIAFDPTNVETYLARGRAYLEAGNVAAAIKDFAKVIELQPQSATAYRERGHAFVLLNAFEEAERDLARSLELAPRAGLTFAYRALMYKKLGEPALGSQEIQKAMKLAPKDPQVLWAKGEIEESLSEIEAAVQSFRSALSADPQLKPAEHGLARLGQPLPNQAVVLDELNFGPWRVVLDRQRFYASHRDIAGLNVPLETVDSGRPRILEWVEKGTDFGNAGLLRFSAGKAKTRQGNVDAEYIALVDTRKKRVLDLIPDRMGERKSKWTWIDGRVTVASVDGLTSQHILKERPKPVARVRRRRRDSWVDGDGVPAWVPWANNTDRPRRRKTRRRRRKPKTLFDLLLGN